MVNVKCDKCGKDFDGFDWMIDAKVKGKQITCDNCYSNPNSRTEQKKDMNKEYNTINERILLGYAVDLVKDMQGTPEQKADKAIEIWKQKFKDLL